MPNAADQSVDWALTQAINLSRIEEGSKANAIAILEDLEAEIVGILSKNKASIQKQQKLKVIQSAASEAIQKHYTKIESNHQEDLSGVAKAQGKGQTKQVNGMLGVSVFDPVLSDKQWEALASKTLVFGAKSGDWWKGQSAGLRDKFGKQMAMGYALGESVDEMTRRVRGTKANGFNDGVMKSSKREAEALVRSSVQTISNTARIESIKGMGPMAKGIQWVSLLDGRTTHICMGLSKKVWSLPEFKPIGHSKAWPGPVAHWKGMDPKKIAQVKVKAQASMDGQVSSILDYEGWLKKKSPEFINKQLGPTRAKLWNDGKLKLEDLTDQKSRPLTIKQLEASIESGDFPSETENTPFPLKGTPAKFSDDTLAKANESAANQILKITANPKGQTFKAKAIAELQKSEPDLSAIETLAKAEGIALAKQDSKNKSTALSNAKKKILAGKKPTKYQKDIINSLDPEEKATFYDQVDAVALKNAIEKAKPAAAADDWVDSVLDASKKPKSDPSDPELQQKPIVGPKSESIGYTGPKQLDISSVVGLQKIKELSGSTRPTLYIVQQE